MNDVERAVAAIRTGHCAVIPTDTVYGLACSPTEEEAVLELAALKGRSPGQPVALLAASVETLLELVPEVADRTAAVVHALLPGPYTLVLATPGHPFRWLTPGAPDSIGVRVPALEGPGRAVLDALGAVAATSANLHGAPNPRRLEDVPVDMRVTCATVDGGELPGTPSTVLDLTGDAPRVLREGAVPATDALARVAAALAG